MKFLEWVVGALSIVLAGVVMGSLKFLFSHAKKHQEIEDSFKVIESSETRNSLEHKDILYQINELKQDQAEVKGLLVGISTDLSWIKKDGGSSDDSTK